VHELCATDCEAVVGLRDEMKSMRREATARHERLADDMAALQREVVRLTNTVLQHVVGREAAPSGVQVTVGGAHIENSNSNGRGGNGGLAEAAGKLLNGVL
jgi:hypothetical protein